MIRKSIIILTVILLLLTMSCAKGDMEVKNEQNSIPVKIIKLEDELRPLTLDYIGIVNSNNLKKKSFKSSGRIEKIFVQKGQKISKGEPLLALDTGDLEYAVRAAKAQLETAEAQYNKAVNGPSQEEISNARINEKKAQDVYDYTKDNYEKMESLYDQGAISKNDLDQSKLELDLRESELAQAQELKKQINNGTRNEDKAALSSQVDQSMVNYEQKVNMMEEGVLISDIDGQVVDILFEEGEMVSAGYPVIVVEGSHQVIKLGLTQKDFSKVQLGTRTRVKVGDIETIGEFVNISQSPDIQTRTYSAEISLAESSFQLGSIAKVEIFIGEERGTWIPISAVLSNGVDYVYTIEDGKALRKTIRIETIRDTEIKVKGLNAGVLLVVEGMKRVTEGDKVLIQE